MALALENSGFDVGMAFPGLRTAWDESGTLGVHLGTVAALCGRASDLTVLLSRAASLPPVVERFHRTVTAVTPARLLQRERQSWAAISSGL